MKKKPLEGLKVVDFGWILVGPITGKLLADAGEDENATYPADVWGQMVNAPQGRFKRAMVESIPDLFGGSRYVSGGYFTQRYAGETEFRFKLAA